MGEIAALVEDVRGALDDHLATADTLDGSLDGAVCFRQFPDECLITVPTVENHPVDTQQGIGPGEFQKTAAYRATKRFRYAGFHLPFVFVIVPGDAEIFFKIDLHPLTEMHQVREQILDVVFVTVEIPTFESQAVCLHYRVDSVGTFLVSWFVCGVLVICHYCLLELRGETEPFS